LQEKKRGNREGNQEGGKESSAGMGWRSTKSKQFIGGDLPGYRELKAGGKGGTRGSNANGIEL